MPTRFLTNIILGICLAGSTGILLGQVSIHDIQYNVDGGTSTYPSPLAGQTVSVGGIVSATNFSKGGFFLSTSNGGPWSGVWVLNTLYSPSIRDSILIEGVVSEVLGETQIINLTSYQRIDVQIPLPDSINISAVDSKGEEAYEGALVSINNLSLDEIDRTGNWQVIDSSGIGLLGSGFLNLHTTGFPLFSGYPFSRITGVVSGNWYGYQVHPRSISDIQSAPGAFVMNLRDTTLYETTDQIIPLQLALLNQVSDISSYKFTVNYDNEMVAFTGIVQSATLSHDGTVVTEALEGAVTVAYTGNFSTSGIETLLKLKFAPLASGSTTLDLTDVEIESTVVDFLSDGQLTIELGARDVGDPLTIIQRPLMNIPSIVIPGQEMEIVAWADESTAGWQAELLHPMATIPLEIAASRYDSDLGRWFLTALVPAPEMYELYDLRLTASGGIEDTTWNSVKIIEQFKDSYYFVQISDTHLPTSIYFEDPASMTDESSIEDLRAVINDVNLLRPEFVLLTGDVIHEGELEEFQERRYYSRTQKVLRELEVPIYVVAGNHDIGGWDSTPPSQGTARRNWWRFFGWPWLDNPPAADPMRTQNYSFDYGVVHYVGLESYINYDRWRDDIYSNDSFTSAQMSWLQNNLFNSSNSSAKVIFYHYDFSQQINLSALGVDMALWGHTHSDEGSINEQPYNIAIGSVTNGKRAFRLVRVDNGDLEPVTSLYAGGSGQNLSISYQPGNAGLSDTVVAEIDNRDNEGFEHGQIKFIMPNTGSRYKVDNGTISQVIRTDSTTICYVDVNIRSLSITEVKIQADGPLQIQTGDAIPQFALGNNYPNPFNASTRIDYTLARPSNVSIIIYDMMGRIINRLTDEQMIAGSHSVIWSGNRENGLEAPSGVYFVRLKAGTSTDVIKIVLMK